MPRRPACEPFDDLPMTIGTGHDKIRAQSLRFAGDLLAKVTFAQ